MQEQQLTTEQQIIASLDKLMAERDSVREYPSRTEDWENLKITGVIDMDRLGKRKVFEKGLKGVQAASLPMVQKYNMDSQSELGNIISDLNKYFKSQRKRIRKDYDNVLYQLSAELQQNQTYIPSEFDKQLSKLFSEFPVRETLVKPVDFVPYKEQIPTSKFEMVTYLCLASVIYGSYENALDDKQKLLQKVGRETYTKGLSVFKKVIDEFQSLLLPALQQFENQGNTKETQDYVKKISKLRKKLGEWEYGVTMGDATRADGYFSNGLYDVSDQDSAYDRLICIANWMYVWRSGWCGKVSGKYVMYPVLELFGNALASDVQSKADAIAKYRCIADYVNHRAAFAKQFSTLTNLTK
ncbi:MAG: hypothetical protein J6T57_02150 [Alphaproteobacteria bacterium]|nr:hypothetical protein [Alphaproteobacteria bacterium]